MNFVWLSWFLIFVLFFDYLVRLLRQSPSSHANESGGENEEDWNSETVDATDLQRNVQIQAAHQPRSQQLQHLRHRHALHIRTQR